MFTVGGDVEKVEVSYVPGPLFHQRDEKYLFCCASFHSKLGAGFLAVFESVVTVVWFILIVYAVELLFSTIPLLFVSSLILVSLVYGLKTQSPPFLLPYLAELLVRGAFWLVMGALLFVKAFYSCFFANAPFYHEEWKISHFAAASAGLAMIFWARVEFWFFQVALSCMRYFGDKKHFKKQVSVLLFRCFPLKFSQIFKASAVALSDLGCSNNLPPSDNSSPPPSYDELRL